MLRSFIATKAIPTWVFTVMEVSTRLWSSFRIGRRSYRNTYGVMQDTVTRGHFESLPLITSDGFEYYPRVVRQLFGHAAVYGQVIKIRRNDRVVTVDRRRRLGAPWRLAQALRDSEDSETLNTSFIERLNLTLRQSSAYLRRQAPCHARSLERLKADLDLVQCWYNFVRPHRALKLGRVTRTPAMQAGLVSRQIAFREVFPSRRTGPTQLIQPA